MRSVYKTLSLENYGTVLRDCSKVLSVNSKSSKAYYRSGQALLRLDRSAEALDCCARCLFYDPANEGVRTLQERATRLKQEADDKERKKQEAKRKEEQAKLAMQFAFRVRSLPVPLFRHV